MAGFTQAHDKCVMKIKRKKRQPHKFFDDREDFVWLLLKLDVTDVDELQDNNSSHNKSTTYLSSRWVNACQKDGFLSVGSRTGTIKLAMAGTYDWWCRFPLLSGYRFYIVGTC